MTKTMPLKDKQTLDHVEYMPLKRQISLQWVISSKVLKCLITETNIILYVNSN